MKKLRLLFASVALLAGWTAQAQNPYTFSVTTQTYQPLTSTTTLNNGIIWDDENMAVALPFNFKLGNTNINRFNLSMYFPSVTTDTQGQFNGFIAIAADVADRGLLTGASSLSPIRYTTTGTAPSRIFKAEIANAGFYYEYDDSGTMNDFINMQVWFYETSNIVEMRFGSSKITSPQSYFELGGKPFMGYTENADLDQMSWDLLMAVHGNPANPSYDSIANGTLMPSLLNTWPANGTVYRFTPKSMGVNNVARFKNVTVFPTNCTDMLQVSFKEPEAAIYVVIGADGKKTNLSGTFKSGMNTIDVSQLAKGNYLLLGSNKDARGIYRFTKM